MLAFDEGADVLHEVETLEGIHEKPGSWPGYFLMRIWLSKLSMASLNSLIFISLASFERAFAPLFVGAVASSYRRGKTVVSSFFFIKTPYFVRIIRRSRSVTDLIQYSEIFCIFPAALTLLPEQSPVSRSYSTFIVASSL